jgi:hypothetical protein
MFRQALRWRKISSGIDFAYYYVEHLAEIYIFDDSLLISM